MQITKAQLNVGTNIVGNPLDIHYYTLKAGKTGKRVYIQSGIHGGEITYWVQHRLFNFLKDNMASGEVVMVPFASPASWEQRSYFYTFGKFDLYDGKDFNSHFPGKADGSLHQRVCHALANLAYGSDLALDLHTARDSLPYCIYTKEAYGHLVKEMGLKYNYLDAEIMPDTAGSFDAAMDPAGIENLCIECGSHDEHDAGKAEQIYQGILRLLANLGIIDKKHTIPAPAECYFFADHKKIVAPDSGFVRYDTELGETFRKGDRLFTLHRTAELGSELAELAREDGVVYKRTPTHIYRVGDDTLHYVPLDWMKKL